MKQIPNLFTLLNLFFGCMAIIVILQNGITLVHTEAGGQMMSMPEQIYLASLFIALAAVVDFLDGFVARLFNAQSEMGKQLDSLADVVSFGVAPGMIIYQFLRLSVARQEDGLDASSAWLYPALLIPCAAAWRLARFNIDDKQTYSFRGVPTPAVGLMVASLPLAFWHTDNTQIIDLFLNKWVWYGLVFALCYLMTCNTPFMSFKVKERGLKNAIPQLALIAIALIITAVFAWTAVPLIFISYILLSLLFKNKIA